MPVYDFSDDEMNFVRAAAADRYAKARARNAAHNGSNIPNLDLDVRGVMGEYAVVRHFRVPIYKWHGLYQFNLPDVDAWEVRTRTVGATYMGLNKRNITSRNLDQRIVLCFASIEHRSVEVYGWTTYRTFRERGRSSADDVFWILDVQHLESF